MAEAPANHVHTTLLYHFCRLRLPAVAVPRATFENHLRRAFELYRAKRAKAGAEPTWGEFLHNLHALDWFLACACLEGQPRAWQALFAARANRADCLLVDALRARAVRLFPRDAERQEEAVTDFWGFLLAGERDGSLPVLARYDGQRPLPADDLDEHDLPFRPRPADEERWYEEFRQAAHDWLADLSDNEVLILGLRLRYRLSQREVAALLGIHEGNVSRQTGRLRDHCLERIGRHLRQQGWTGDDLDGFLFKEMDNLLLDEPRLSADRLAALLAARKKPTGRDA